MWWEFVYIYEEWFGMIEVRKLLSVRVGNADRGKVMFVGVGWGFLFVKMSWDYLGVWWVMCYYKRR